MHTAISDEAYMELERVVGEDNVSREPAVLDGYAWQPFLNEDPSLWTPRPAAVVLPASTPEVQEVVRACNRHGLKFKALCTGWGVHAGPTSKGVVQIDLRRMNRILEIDEKNMYAVLEPYVSGAQLQAESMKRGPGMLPSGQRHLHARRGPRRHIHELQPPQRPGRGVGPARRGDPAPRHPRLGRGVVLG
ncbi:MAG: FAD-dependent oxidoreductase [Actinomycetota bacterium]|nr:FAD-dependent oxidoreductase [Actinomycetota bacterium]